MAFYVNTQAQFCSRLKPRESERLDYRFERVRALLRGVFKRRTTEIAELQFTRHLLARTTVFDDVCRSLQEVASLLQGDGDGRPKRVGQ